MTTEEITAKNIAMNLHSAVGHLVDARRLINEQDHTIAWANTTQAIRETEQAIRMMRQDYANSANCDGCGHKRIDHIVSGKTLEGYCNIRGCACTRFDVLEAELGPVCESCGDELTAADPNPRTDGEPLFCRRCA